MKINSSISKSAYFGKLEFPTRKDYVKYFLDNKVVQNEKEIWDNKEYVSIIHRHWHGEGRNGCVFALLSARNAEESGWQDHVITKKIEVIEKDDTKVQIQKRIKKAIVDSKCEILSLLFSNITVDLELIRLIKQLLIIRDFSLSDKKIIDDHITLALRIPITSDGILSWVMAFGPYEYFPLTRQSPITEITIRVKPKPEIQFHRLNKDKDAAHLADLPIDYKVSVTEQIWQNTIKRTRIILGEEPNHFSAAKTTFTLPRRLWKNPL